LTLLTPNTEEAIDDTAVEIGDGNMLALEPLAEIGNGDDMPSDGLQAISLLNPCCRIRVQVFGQGTLPQPFYRAGKNKKLV
jgi:hypothetical protein